MEGLSAILEVIIGLVFIYMVLSLLVSAVVEYLEMWLRKRGRLLRFGLLELLKDQRDAGGHETLVDALYLNPLIYALYKGKPNAGRAMWGGNLPSYIPPNTFVLALIDELAKQRGSEDDKAGLNSAADIVALIENSPILPMSLRSALRVVLSQVQNNDYNRAIKKLEEWYDGATLRVSGWYKKHTQWLSMGIALVIAVAVNVDTLFITHSLMVNSSLRSAIVQSADSYLGEAAINGDGKKPAPVCSSDEECNKQALIRLDALKTQLASLGLPIGWQSVDWNDLAAEERMSKLLGWLLTTIAISFGAPFWFDVLNKFMSFRSAIKPRIAEDAKQDKGAQEVVPES